MAEIGTLTPIHNKVFWNGKLTVVHGGLYPSSKGIYPWVIASDVISSTGYFQRPLLIKKKLHIQDYPQEIWGTMNPNQLGGLRKEISAQPPGRILEVVMRSEL